MYTREELPQYVKTAGKVTILTAVIGFLVFMAGLAFDFGAQELNKVSAQSSATTSLRVLNTPPSFVLNPYEVVESSTSSPTNSGDDIQWSAIANDSNDAPYFLLICDQDLPPVPTNNTGGLGTAPPACNAGAQQWAVSPATPSNSLATATVTTIDSSTPSIFDGEVHEWYAWVCDDDAEQAECNAIAQSGDYATSSSPFHVNSRPVLTNASNTSPANPGDTFSFTSTSSDPDGVGGDDLLSIIVCNDNTSYNSTTNTCGAAEFASTTVPAVDINDAIADYTLGIPFQDQTYPAYVYLIDEHGHEATAPIQADFIVANVAPTVLNSSIDLNDGANITLDTAGGETTGLTLQFTITDNNSNVAANNIDPEIVDWGVSIFRSPLNSTTTCNLTAGYDPNNCYTNGSSSATWNLSCTATSTTVLDPTLTDVTYNCTFPLWFVADPTDFGPFAADEWVAAVQGIDNNNATGSMTVTNAPRELIQFPFLDIVDAEIAYGAIAPGDFSNLTATSVTLNLGNTGLDQQIEGESMCPGFAPGPGNECVHTGTTTIPASEQQYATSSINYSDPGSFILSSSSPQLLELAVPKNVSTSTINQGTTFWGINVPAIIELAGDYTGLNSFLLDVSDDANW